jgi:MFS family permease
MWVGAAFALVSTILAPLQAGAVRDQLESQPSVPGLDVDTLVDISIGFGIAFGLIALGLWVWMAIMNRRGRNWARVVATVLGGLNIAFVLVSFLGAFAASPTALATVFSLISLALAAVILFLLWRPESSEWYTPTRPPVQQWAPPVPPQS